jgi:hypothetical protein
MRTGFSVLFLIGVMAVPAAAHAPFSTSAELPMPRNFASARAPSHIDLPSADSFLYRHREDTEGLTFDTTHTTAPQSGTSGPAIDIGAFHAEIGGTGTHAHLAHYTLEGVQVMGGTVSGSIDGKSARVTIDW